MRLKDKAAIITGAASGFGRATAILFAKEGAKVAVADLNDAQGEETVRTIAANGGQAIFVHTDVSNAVEVERLVRATVETFGDWRRQPTSYLIDALFSLTNLSG